MSVNSSCVRPLIADATGSAKSRHESLEKVHLHFNVKINLELCPAQYGALLHPTGNSNNVTGLSKVRPPYGDLNQKNGTDRNGIRNGGLDGRQPGSNLNTGASIRRVFQYACGSHTPKNRFPILRWLPLYSWSFLVHDLVAGLTVGLTAIPQGIAYAVVAGLEPQYGLYSGFMGSFVYLFLGSTKDITIGPTAIMALMTQTYVRSYGADFAVLLTFLSGCIITMFGLFQLGFLVDFISLPVTTGFTSAAAVTIGTAQLKGLFGLTGRTDKFLDSFINFLTHVHQTKAADALLGFSTIAALLLMMRLGKLRIKQSPGQPIIPRYRLIFGNVCWLISLSRNAVVVFIGVLIAYICSLQGVTPFSITGKIGEGMPPFGLPPFSTTFKNVTYEFTDMVIALDTSLIAIPLIAVLESVAIAKAFSNGKAIDATQEMIALGVSNIAGSFVRSMPVTGSFTRTAVNNASGVRTPAGGIVTAALVLLALGFLTSTFNFIPKATLAGVIITAMIFMVDYKVIGLLWRTKRLDLIPLSATFIFCLFVGLEYGILVGIAVNVVFLLYYSARPSVNMEVFQLGDKNILVVAPAEGLSFPSAEHVRESVISRCQSLEGNAQDRALIIDGAHLIHVDSTVCKAVKHIVEDLKKLNVPVYFWRWPVTVQSNILGLDPDLRYVFRDADTLEELLSEYKCNGIQTEDDAEENGIPTIQ